MDELPDDELPDDELPDDELPDEELPDEVEVELPDGLDVDELLSLPADVALASLPPASLVAATLSPDSPGPVDADERLSVR